MTTDSNEAPARAATSLTTTNTEHGLAVVHPATGEQLLLSAPDERLAEWLKGTRELESRLRELKGLLTEEVNARMDSRAAWTHRWGGFKVSGVAPTPEDVYDGDELAKVLKRLVKKGKIDAEAAANACERVVTWKPKKAGINRLLKLGGDVAEAIKATAEQRPRDRKVTISRLDGTPTE